jgi:hypothetical protein
MKKDQLPKPPSAIERFLTKGSEHHGPHKTYPWKNVLWLTGVDYFSTLGYQPGIAFVAALGASKGLDGSLSPMATALLVVVTLFGALPTYIEVSKRSYQGQGSISMLESLLKGWFGKVFVLALLGFAATDFVITMTLSAADAAAHAVENPYLHDIAEGHQIGITLFLLAMLAVVFLAGFTEAIGLAVAVGVPYILFSAVVIGYGLSESLASGGWDRWLNAESLQGDWLGLLFATAFLFPKLALGMSGFETGVSVMPLISGGKEEDEAHLSGPPAKRISNTAKLLTTAALIMSGLLLSSSFVTTTMIPQEAFLKCGDATTIVEGMEPGKGISKELFPHCGEANGRALAYLAHSMFGDGLGTVYDFLTIAILWFAGASAMAGLLNLIPRYLPRFGMAPRWVSYSRPLVLLLFAIDVIVTLIFKADVDAQAGAYATGVLVLILSAAIAVTLALRKDSLPTGDTGQTPSRTPAQRQALWKSFYFAVVAVVFAFTLIDNVFERPDGVIISSIFIVSIIILSGISRWWRATELRVEQHQFIDEESQKFFEQMKGKKINLVPLRTDATYNRTRKEQEIRKYYKVTGNLAFLHIDLQRDRSNFSVPLKISVRAEKNYHNHEENEDSVGISYVINVQGAVAIANTVAYISEQLDPISLFLGLTRGNHMSQTLKYLMWGEGETGIMVYQILVRHWESTLDDDVRPLIFLISE